MPATASKEGLLYSPYMARFIATVAELLFYHIWAIWIGQPFWGHPLGWICIFGETVSWSHIIFQSEALAICEDTTWTIHAAMMTYWSATWI